MPTIHDCALMAQDVYNDNQTNVNGHRPVYVPSGGALMSNHFFGAAYMGLANIGVIAFRGSQEIEDWAYADVDIARGRLPVDQIGNAFAFFSAAKKELLRHGCRRLVVTGHSLGGGLAAVVAARISQIHCRAVTFNAPGMAGLSRVVAPEDDGPLLKALNVAMDGEAGLAVRAGAALASGFEFSKKVVNTAANALVNDSSAEARVVLKANDENVWNFRTYYDPISLTGAHIGIVRTIPYDKETKPGLVEIGLEHTMKRLVPQLEATHFRSHQA